MIFPDTAPPVIPLQERGPVLFEGRQYTYEQAMVLHHDLGQTLARMMRKRGSSTPPGPVIGGTPMALAA